RGVERDLVVRRVDVRDHDVDRVAHLDDLVGRLDALDREIRGVEEAVDARLELDEGAERLEPYDLAGVADARRVFLRDLLPRVGDGGLVREPDLPLVVDLHDDDARGLAGLADVARAVAPVVVPPRDRAGPLEAADVDEGAERDDAPPDALDLFADFELRERLGALRATLG